MTEATIIPYEGKMTRENAIDILRCQKDGNAVEALEMAIKALEQEPCEDCISREEVMNCVDNRGGNYYFNLREQIKKLPSVIPIEALKDSRPTGEWIREKNGTYTCNLCGANIWGYWLEHVEANFCPQCGAKMK